jgi:hypothetical protein
VDALAECSDRRVRGCLDSWVSGFLGVWIPGFRNAPTDEFVGVWIPGFLVDGARVSLSPNSFAIMPVNVAAFPGIDRQRHGCQGASEQTASGPGFVG